MEPKLLLVVGISSILLSSCALFGTPYVCSEGTTVDDPSKCTEGVAGGGGAWNPFATQSGCSYNNPPCSSYYNCINNECVRKKGCYYSNPSCPNQYDCINNECILKKGCAYNNPPCLSDDYDCIDNVCVKKKGCLYNNPSCDDDYDCINNGCVLKEGCAYNNPSCSSGYSCVNNECVLKKQISTSSGLTVYENGPYYGMYCDKINPYDLSVRQAAADAIRKHPGSYSTTQLFDIYDWVRGNIIYQNVALTEFPPYPPSETLLTKSGDCKNQAVLIASMIEAIGGTAKVVLDPTCKHAYTIVYLGPAENDISAFTYEIALRYGLDTSVTYFTGANGLWVIFDPAGGNYPGNTLPECSGNRTVYYVTSCMVCSQQYPTMPYSLGSNCYSQCPSGTVTANDHACEFCPEGYSSCNNQCISCPSGYYLAVDCKCYRQ